MTVERKMEHLRELFKSNGIVSGKGAAFEFEKWFQSASKARALRNRYIHGIWEYLPTRFEKPVGVRAPVWMKEKVGTEGAETMSLDELEGVADEVGSVFEELMRLRRKHGV
jgi:hypothetical protein